MRMRAKMLDRLLEMAEQLIEEAEQTREKARLHGEALRPVEDPTLARCLALERQALKHAMARKMMDELNANRGRRIASEAQAELVQMAFAFVDMSKNATLDDVAYNGEWRGWLPREGAVSPRGRPRSGGRRPPDGSRKPPPGGPFVAAPAGPFKVRDSLASVAVVGRQRRVRERGHIARYGELTRR